MGYNDKNDFICKYKLGELLTNNLKWSGQVKFNKIENYTKTDFGLLKQCNNFSFVE